MRPYAFRGRGSSCARILRRFIASSILNRRTRDCISSSDPKRGHSRTPWIDELLNPVLGLTPGPLAFPWQTHARGLGGHLAFGVATELVLEGLDRVA